MSNTINPFVTLVNAYYQALAYSLNYKAQGTFGTKEMLPELEDFRDFLIRESPIFAEAIQKDIVSRNQGSVEMALIINDFTKTYKINQIFTNELDNSVIQFLTDGGGNITSYRITFQLGSDSINSLVGSAIQSLGTHINLRDGIYKMVNDILTQNYWEGEELLQSINSIRVLNTHLHLSHNWIKEYSYQMLTA